MRKILWLARREYKASVRTKGFIIGLVLAPVFMGGSGIAMAIFENRVDTTDKTIAVIDHTGIVAEPLARAAQERNGSEVHEKETGKKVKPAYIIEVAEPDPEDPVAQRLELSNRVRDGGLHAFVEIGPEALHPGKDMEASRIKYYAKNAAMDDVRDWIGWPINLTLRQARLAEKGIDESQVGDVFTWLSIDGLGLVSVDQETGQVLDAKQSSEGEAILVPVVMGMLMFLMVLMGAMPQLQSVMEEKTQRIAEVLLGHIKPFEFMAGKVLGGVAVSLTAAAVYFVGGAIGLKHMGLAQYIPLDVIPWFFAYMLMAIVMMGAMLAAFGAACNDAKDAQNLTMPAMIPVMIPLFIMFPVLKEPMTGFATGLSLFPIFTPMLMVMRLSTPLDIPLWQPLVGLAGVLAFTVLSVWAAGRIFRVCILMQGKPPRLPDLVRWAIRG
jgi:ABC-2 type transport system permease protein